MYNGSKIPVVGKRSLTVAHESNSFKVSFIILDSDPVPILGLKKSEHLQLMKRIRRIETNNEKFISEFHVVLEKGDVKPVVTPVRKNPHALKKIKKEFQRMVDLDLIELIKKPTD